MSAAVASRGCDGCDLSSGQHWHQRCLECGWTSALPTERTLEQVQEAAQRHAATHTISVPWWRATDRGGRDGLD